MWSWRLAGTRARAVQPASATAAKMCVAVSQSTRLCSISTLSQAKPARARKRAAVMLPSDSHVPTDGWPAFNARLTALDRMEDAFRVRSIFVEAPLRRRDAASRLADGSRTGAARQPVVGRHHVVLVVVMRVFVLLAEAIRRFAGGFGNVGHEVCSSLQGNGGRPSWVQQLYEF